ncbi:MAG TPA: divergent polysaccharide deacetylase family protein [Rhizomicrobium sp.]|nr:divergent polysaccharide deacetylase family protein [Rhizomicrobium sp.]
MAHRHPIRSKKPDAGHVAFWLVLALAIGVGGGSALSGLPALAGLLIPPGTMAAQAQGDLPLPEVSLPIRVAANTGFYSPQVLTPVSAHGFPDWLLQRMGLMRSAPPAAPVPPHPAIAVVIDDLGADVPATRRAMALPRAVNLSFLPYPENTPMLAREAGRRGHQILLHVPMEPEGRDDPGPNALRADLGVGEISRRLNWALSRVPGYSGINNHMGSRFTQDRTALVPVMERLADAHVFFLDSRTTPNSVVVSVARIFGVPSAARDVFLDDIETRDAIAAQLAETEARARANGVAIAIGHPHAVTLDMLAAWSARIEARGFQLVPVSVAIRMKSERDTRSLAATH